MVLIDQSRAIQENIARSVKRLGPLRGFSSYLYSVLVRKCPFARGKLVNLTVPGTGIRVKARLGTHDAAAFRQIFLTGDYDFPLPRAPRVIVDAGAHVGYGATFFALRYPDAQIYSVEPEPSNVSVLRINVAQHRNVDVLEAALWNSSGEVAIADLDADVWSFRVQDSLPGEDDRGVRAITMQQIIDRAGYVDLLKLDIEGAEVELFGGDVKWLESVGCIVIELHDEHRAGCSESFYKALKGREYREERLGENLVVRFGTE